MSNPGTRIRQLREEFQLSQLELAKKLDINNSVLSRIESGKRDVEDFLLVKFADFFGVSTDYLLGRTDLPKAFTPDTFAAKVAPELEGYSELPEEAKKTLKDVLAFLYNKYGIKKEEE